ncbi:hypothetical protein DF268_04110 [Streptomyces sp. V2]|uniref:Secreted protein n=1 Tax=Streptomyces niveiscabiei TaxID=164115 RepID=A0ABW9HR32_9ACTN|nr:MULTISPECIES: hypothetical protein [Streptomyces]PWG14922.1 hypothetical protein DF268_04110 [Streptomyces sp. V2]QZZ31813.1 hypothetical protein A7X85_41350 [Streptomyces sp. ST1015]
MVISRAQKILIAGAGVGVALTGGAALAIAAPKAAPAAGDEPPYAVESFAYPDAARIQAEQGIKLVRGDGRITLVACDDAADQIKVLSRAGTGDFCFAATSPTGFLTLELADVFAVQTESHPVRVELSAEGQTETVDVPKNDFQGVGEGIGKPPTVLLEIRVTG